MFEEKSKQFGNAQKIVIGFVYIPPIGSNYYDDEMFAILEQEITILKYKEFDILLAGDFNASTEDLTDFVEF